MTGPAVPHPTPETAPHWEAATAGRLEIQRCEACATWTFPPRLRCQECGRDALRWTMATGRGRLWSYIVVHRPEQGFEDLAPYVLGVIELDEGPHMTGMVRGVGSDPAQLMIDEPLVVDFEIRAGIGIPVWIREDA